jgi:uncharacterized membrane protein (DUF2068 family)
MTVPASSAVGPIEAPGGSLEIGTPTHSPIEKGVRSVAVFEALKGAVVLIAGFGLLHYVHRDLQAVSEELVRHSHLNPAHHYPHVFIEAASHTSSGRMRALAGLAFLYSSVRFVEAYGLWRLRAWAEWFAIISGSIYVPIEIYELARHATVIRVLVLLINLFIVAYLIYVRWTNAAKRKEGAESASPAATAQG